MRQPHKLGFDTFFFKRESLKYQASVKFDYYFHYLKMICSGGGGELD